MMEGVRAWLMALISLCVLCAVAEALMPAGGVKQAGRLVFGLALMCAVLSPAVEPDWKGGEVWLEEYAGRLEARKQVLERQMDEEMKSIIEEKYAAYIVDKASKLGLDCTARVDCREEEGLFLPHRTQVTGALGSRGQDSLARIIEGDLGVPLERQSYFEGGQP